MFARERTRDILAVALVLLATIVMFAMSDGGFQKLLGQNSQQVCTQEAKLCPDGSAVGRTGPNCEFAACEPVYCDSCDVRTSVPTADWKTYRNEEYGFEFKYPADWTYYEEGSVNEQSGFFVGLNSPSMSGSIIDFSVSKDSFDEVIENTVNAHSDFDRPTEQITINGIKMIKILDYGDNYETGYELYFHHNGLVYRFGEGFAGQLGDKEKIEALHSTFKFID